MKPPIIIVGSHRSGTTAVAKAMQQLGLFIGPPDQCDENAESLFFLRLHEQYLREIGASWHQPQAALAHLSTCSGRAHCRDFLQYGIDGNWGGAQSLLRRYSGPRHALSLLRGAAWGWKDPRTTLLAPAWLDVFPKAKILHVLRHPIDVALSLQARQNALADPSPMMQAPQLRQLEHALHLVQIYVECAVSLRHLGERYYAIHYEELQQNPAATLQQISEFCELPRKNDFTKRLHLAAAEIESTGHDSRLSLSSHQTAQLWENYPSELRFEYS